MAMTFNEAAHPRTTDGQFTETAHSEPALSLAAEPAGRTPAVIGDPPRARASHHLQHGQPSEATDRAASTTTTSTPLSGDEKFNAAIRSLLGAPEDAPVSVEMDEHRNWYHPHTEEFATVITVIAGDKKKRFDDLGELMRELTQAEDSYFGDKWEQSEQVKEMALRFTRSPEVEGPLTGTAAVYIEEDDLVDPTPVFGEILALRTEYLNEQIDFRHLDGREETIDMDRIAAILATDQSTDA